MRGAVSGAGLRASAAVEPGTLAPGAGQFIPVPPGQVVGNVAVVSGGVHTFTLAERFGLPEASEVSAVVLQVLLYAPTQASYLRVYPADHDDRYRAGHVDLRGQRHRSGW
ncbi:MAG TPA: hypothetical protein VFR67_21190 [Pilimelia sp.]|nr:hypothetical protein [Pilimelia sp.]